MCVDMCACVLFDSGVSRMDCSLSPGHQQLGVVGCPLCLLCRHVCLHWWNGNI